MPSPIAHWTVGLVVCRWLWPRSAMTGEPRSIPWVWLVPTSLVLSLLPDAGSVIGVISGDFGRFHNSWEHSLLVGVGCAAIVAGAVWALGRDGWRWGAMVFLSFELHVLMDLFTIGRGVRIFWPIVEDRYSPTFKLFYGLHWSDGWLSTRHLVTLLSEAAFAALIAAGLYGWLRRGRGAGSAGAVRGQGTVTRP